MRAGRRAVRMALTIAVAASAIAFLPTAAEASWDTGMSTVNHYDCKGPDPRAAEALFTAYGDWFTVRDVCADGHSAQIQVDVEPLGGANYYDWKYTESRGWGYYARFQRNQPEDREIAIRVCVTQGANEVVACGPWKIGLT